MGFRLAFALTLLIGSAPICAQTAAAQPDITREQARVRAHQLFAMFDVYHTGLVARSEASHVGMKLMMKRAATGRDAAPGIGGRTLNYLEKAFAGRQSASEQQFEDAFLAHFDAMDTNHDGILTAAERQVGRSSRR
jgi:hypothetical protein